MSQQEPANLSMAIGRLGEALLRTPEARLLRRLCAWLAVRLAPLERWYDGAPAWQRRAVDVLTPRTALLAWGIFIVVLFVALLIDGVS